MEKHIRDPLKVWAEAIEPALDTGCDREVANGSVNSLDLGVRPCAIAWLPSAVMKLGS